MNDKQVFGHIEELVEEEERLYAHDKLSPEDLERLQVVKVELGPMLGPASSAASTA